MEFMLDVLSMAAGGAAALLLLAAFLCAAARPRWTRTLLVPGLLLCALAIFAQLAELSRLAAVGDFAAIEDTVWVRCVCGGALLVWSGGWSAAASLVAKKAEGPA